eukprot:CAMPEP_0202061412 /NCGR_PEP_ID=MMETSP0963-20130614/40988_1 /ASSEMBLY_ACC=CAM_ASM_000494 /TAXON_ID=4773 /ORGANISM="Schizochytrium aggregatum, Strain ATCC28209" /LENGTH=85 /DNA_ID=CAMNT_0048627607 /DNA_START=133 /DNA_END=388 /DNA_ORIENTATION=+
MSGLCLTHCRMPMRARWLKDPSESSGRVSRESSSRVRFGVVLSCVHGGRITDGVAPTVSLQYDIGHGDVDTDDAKRAYLEAMGQG